jgi:hypothetical protein
MSAGRALFIVLTRMVLCDSYRAASLRSETALKLFIYLASLLQAHASIGASS